MKFVFILLVALAFVLTVSGQKVKENNSAASPHVGKQATPVFDQLLLSYLGIFQRKLERNSMNQHDQKVLEFLLRLIYMRQKEMDQDGADSK